MTEQMHSKTIKDLAKALGFMNCGIAKADVLSTEANRLEQWLNNGYHGKMHYMEQHFDKRIDTRKLVPGAQTVVSLMYNYASSFKPNFKQFKVSKYALGEDYHQVVKDKCYELVHQLQAIVGQVSGRVFVDSAPVMERAWAERSGLGWIGKHGLLINKQMGSYGFLAELIIDLPCEPDLSTKDHCGTCTKCIDACPTQAILPDKTLNASHCISYLTIELKDQIPAEFSGKTDQWIFGCDVCQEVCPWNRFSTPNQEPRFTPNAFIEKATDRDWIDITEHVFDQVFEKSPISRTQWQGLKRNIDFQIKADKK